MKTPYHYQMEAIVTGCDHNLIIADECGLGKTLTAIMIIKKMIGDQNGSALVVAPKRTLAQWEAELDEQGMNHERIGLKGITAIAPNTVYVIHYEALVRNIPIMTQFLWTCVIADEAHRIKNRDTLRTRALKKLRTLRKIALTGTPMEKSPADLWSLLHWVYPHTYGSYWKFCDRYVRFDTVFRGRETYKVIVGGQNLEALARELRYVYVRRTKEQVAPQLPPKIFTHVAIDMADKQKRLYDIINKSKDIEVDLSELSSRPRNLVIPNKLAQIIALQAVSSIPKLVQPTDPKIAAFQSGKLEWLDGFLEDNEDPVVIFTRFRGTAFAILERYKKEASIIIGGRGVLPYSTGDDFLSGKTRILVGTIAAMGEGLNLQRAETAIFFETDWSATLMSQAVDRVHRINITAPKQIIYLIASPIDKLIVEAVDHKWTEAELVQEYVNRVQQEEV